MRSIGLPPWLLSFLLTVAPLVLGPFQLVPPFHFRVYLEIQAYFSLKLPELTVLEVLRSFEAGPLFPLDFSVCEAVISRRASNGR